MYDRNNTLIFMVNRRKKKALLPFRKFYFFVYSGRVSPFIQTLSSKMSIHVLYVSNRLGYNKRARLNLLK